MHFLLYKSFCKCFLSANKEPHCRAACKARISQVPHWERWRKHPQGSWQHRRQDHLPHRRGQRPGAHHCDWHWGSGAGGPEGAGGAHQEFGTAPNHFWTKQDKGGWGFDSLTNAWILNICPLCLQDNVVEDTMSVDPKHHRYFVARRGQVLRDLADEYGGVMVSFPRTGSQSEKVTLKGAKECVEAAKKRMLEIVDDLVSRYGCFFFLRGS